MALIFLFSLQKQPSLAKTQEQNILSLCVKLRSLYCNLIQQSSRNQAVIYSVTTKEFCKIGPRAAQRPEKQFSQPSAHMISSVTVSIALMQPMAPPVNHFLYIFCQIKNTFCQILFRNSNFVIGQSGIKSTSYRILTIYKKGGSPGLMVIRGGCGFESRHRIPDGHF